MSVDRDGRVPLHHAALENKVNDVKAMIEAGADPNTADRHGMTPLHFAAQQGSLEAAQALLDHGADVDSADSDGITPLFVAVANSRSEGGMIILLRRAGAEPFRANVYGNTPVSFARLVANFDIAQFFADLPAQPSPLPVEARPENEDSEPADGFESLWLKYVPSYGQADTVQGELLRAVEKLRDEAVRNGNINWDSGHTVLAKFVRDTLKGSDLVSAEEVAVIDADIDLALDAEYPADDDVYNRLATRIMEWCEAHPSAVPREHDPSSR